MRAEADRLRESVSGLPTLTSSPRRAAFNAAAVVAQESRNIPLADVFVEIGYKARNPSAGISIATARASVRHVASFGARALV